MTREELLDKLEKTLMVDIAIQAKVTSDMIADLILEDRARICEPLVKAEQRILHNQADDKNLYVANKTRKIAIDEVLKLSGIQEKESK